MSGKELNVNVRTQVPLFSCGPGSGWAGGCRSSRWWSRGVSSSCWGDLGGPWPERDPAVESGTRPDVAVSGPPGTAVGPDSPCRPGACPRQRASSTHPNSHTGEPECGTGTEKQVLLAFYLSFVTCCSGRITIFQPGSTVTEVSWAGPTQGTYTKTVHQGC